jgi:signal transduction histidine kinase
VGVESSLWRAIALYRVGAMAYAVYLTADTFRDTRGPAMVWVVVAGMAAWTAVALWAYAAPSRRGWPLLLADLTAAALALYGTVLVNSPQWLIHGAPTLPLAWVAAPVLAFAVAKGRRYAGAAALCLSAVDAHIRGFGDGVLNGFVLFLLAGLVLGYLKAIAATAERRMQQATQIEAANRERERLARSIHDSVLQALALIQRRGAELGGPAAELGLLAGEQGAVLRTLVGVRDIEPFVDAWVPGGRGEPQRQVDLRALLRQYSSPLVSVAVPATTVGLPVRLAGEVHAAVAAALSNVAAHAGTGGRAFVLVEDEGDTITVTVRDDGVGMAPTRVTEAEAAGRLGIAQSIQGRIRDISGTVTITSHPGAGTEVEMRVPRPGVPRPRLAG